VAIARRIAPLATEGLDLLPDACRGCVRWELGPLGVAAAQRHGCVATAKRGWWEDALLEGSAGGVLARIDNRPVGYATWSLAARSGGGAAAPSAPVSPDAKLLMALRVDPEHRGTGLGRWLVQAVVGHALRQPRHPGRRSVQPAQGVRALEAYGTHRPGDDDCLVPVAFLLACGFEVVREHPRSPRLRLDARRLATWRADVEEAWVRLRGAVRPGPVLEPAGRTGSRRVAQLMKSPRSLSRAALGLAPTIDLTTSPPE